MLIRITAPYFVAGVVLNIRHNSFQRKPTVYRAAPILAYMHGWDRERILRYALRKRWSVEEVWTSD